MIIEMVQDVIDLINGGTYSQSFTAEQRWTPATEKSDGSLLVYVWLDSVEMTRDTRCGDSALQQVVKVGFRRSIDVGSIAQVNDLISLSEEVAQHILRNRTSDGHIITAVDWSTVVDNEALFEDSIAVTILELELKEIN